MKVTTSVITERRGRFCPPIDFKEINMKADIMTSFEYDDEDLTKVTFIHEDANGKLNPQLVDLAKFGLDVNYILETVRA
jgi:hypothetical protein